MDRRCFVGFGDSSRGLELDVETALVCFIARFLEIPCQSLTFLKSKNECRPMLKYVKSNYFRELNISEANCFESRPLPFVRDEKRSINYIGLCTVLRCLVKTKDEYIYLLGEYQNCFKACAEISKWTDLCENVFLRAVKDCIQNADDAKTKEDILNILHQLEDQLSSPPIVSNVNKRRRDAKSQMSNLEVDLLEVHPFIGGLDFLLLDLVICCFLCIILQVNYSFYLDYLEKFPRLFAWFFRMAERNDVKSAMTDVFGEMPQIFPQSSDLIYVKNDSSGDAQPKVGKKSVKVSEQQTEGIISKMLNRGFTHMQNKIAQFSSCSNFSDCLHEIKEILPDKRFARKCEQLENLIKPVFMLASKWLGSCKIVDFCCGSGYLGIALSNLLPKCQIILVENKEESLSRAFPILEERKLAMISSGDSISSQQDAKNEHLRKSNIEIYQCNLDYFQEKFDIGVCLHGCGLVTDLVLQKCFKNKAAFVICPCCYGAIKNVESLNYPKCESLKNIISYKEYTVLAHAADQSELGIRQFDLAKKCMTFIDTDRLLEAQIHGYKTWLFTMNPSSCTPKNNLLIGIHPENPINFILEDIFKTL